MNLRAHLVLGVAIGCTPKSDSASNSGFEGTAPDWALTDVNPASPTAGEVVSPSDLRGQVSLWYFAHST